MAQDLKKRIMRRIYVIWFVRRGLPMFGGIIVSVFVALRVAADSFFVAEIIRSFEYVLTSNIWGFPRYITAALDSAEPSVLILISLAGLTGFALAVKLLRSVRSILAGGFMASAERQRF